MLEFATEIAALAAASVQIALLVFEKIKNGDNSKKSYDSLNRRKIPKVGHKRSFLFTPPAPPDINDLDGTKTHDKTFAVLGGFWHSAA